MNRYDVVVTGYPAAAAESATQTLQRILEISEAEAAAFVASFPCVVRSSQEGPEARRVGLALKHAGVAVELRVSTAAPEPEPKSSYVIGDLALGEAAPVVARAAPQPAPVEQPSATIAKPGESAATGNVQMLDDGFGGEGESGPALELDYEAGVKKPAPATAKKPQAAKAGPASATAPKATADSAAAPKAPVPERKSTPQAAPAAGQKYAVHGAEAEAPKRGRINVRDKDHSRGVFATAILPLVLVLVCAGGAYKVYGAGLGEPQAPVRSGRAIRMRKALAAASKAAVDPPSVPSAPTEMPGKDAPPVAATPAAKSEGVMEWSVATQQRERIHGVHKVSVAWPSDVKHDKTECLLLDTKYSNKLPQLESTGTRFEPPPAIAAQLAQQMEELQASKRYKDRTFVSLCLAN